MNHPEESPAFVLAEEGYDVWMLNQRGNSYSRSHKHLNPDSKNRKVVEQFFDFSFQELGEVDLPNQLAFIKEQAGVENVTYIGHSLGATNLMTGLAKTNLPVNLAISLAPITKLEHMVASWPVHFVADNMDIVKWFADLIGYYEHGAFWTNELMRIACGLLDDVCLYGETWLYATTSEYEDPDRFQVYMGHSWKGVSMRLLYHLAQEVRSGNFEKYDHGTALNKQFYRQE